MNLGQYQNRKSPIQTEFEFNLTLFHFPHSPNSYRLTVSKIGHLPSGTFPSKRSKQKKVLPTLPFAYLLLTVLFHCSSRVSRICTNFSASFSSLQSRMTQHLKLSVDATHFTSQVRFWPAATEFGLASPRGSLAKVLHAICRGDNGLSLASGVFRRGLRI